MLSKVKQFVKDSFQLSVSGKSLEHFEQTLYWLLQLKPDADEAMQIAAYAHDIARAFRKTSSEETYKDRDLNDSEILRIHQKEGAAIMKQFLEENGYTKEDVDRIVNMISKHEVGGDDESNLIMDADSISYLETVAPRHVAMQSLGKEKIRRKIDWMFNRISSTEAKQLAKPFYEKAMNLLNENNVVFEKIKTLLNSHGIEYKLMHHGPTRTSQESADARGEDLSIGGKGLVVKVDDSFKLFVLSAAKKLDSNAIELHFRVKGIRFATPDELMELTGLVSGSVPPFGQPVLDLDLYVDTSITQNEKIAFNAGSLTDSIIMSTKDYLVLAKPNIFLFSK